MPAKSKDEVYEKALGRKLTDAERKKLESLNSIVGEQERDPTAYEGAELLKSKGKAGDKTPLPTHSGNVSSSKLADTELRNAWNPSYFAGAAAGQTAEPMTELERRRAEMGGVGYVAPAASAAPVTKAPSGQTYTIGNPAIANYLTATGQMSPADAQAVRATIDAQPPPPPPPKPDVGDLHPLPGQDIVGDMMPPFVPGQKKVIKPYPDQPAYPTVKEVPWYAMK